MARPKLPYCPNCACDIKAAHEHLVERVRQYLRSTQRAYTHEMARYLFPKGPTGICYYSMLEALKTLDYVCVEESAGESKEPAFWIPRTHAKNRKFVKIVQPGY